MPKRILITGNLDDYQVQQTHIDHVTARLETTLPYSHTINIDLYGGKDDGVEELYAAMKVFECAEVSIYTIRDKFGMLTASISDIALLQPEWSGEYIATLDENQTVLFNVDRRLGQNQYASQLARGVAGSPELGAGLRWKNADSGDYHSLRIHMDDLAEFHRRHAVYKRATSQGDPEPMAFLEPVIRDHEVPPYVDES